MDPKDRLITALDFPSFAEAKAFVEELGDSLSFYKSGYGAVLCSRPGNHYLSQRKEQKGVLDLAPGYSQYGGPFLGGTYPAGSGHLERPQAAPK